ncbi:MAG: hypothetical protein ACJ8AO_11675 [Gemmatimonadaceae bacterium]
MPDRRYSDDDARRILALATEVEAAAPLALNDGWTLEELQRAAAEAGLSPASVAAAALTLDRAAAPDARYLGLPVAVSRAVALPRALSDDEWERLVGRLRDTFGAQGRVEVSGRRREWRVGNLRVTHEPAGDAGVLALRTRKGDARVLPIFGTGLLIVAGTLALLGSSAGLEPRRWMGVALVGVIGVASLVAGLVRLPVWAHDRARQFEALGAFARRLTGST